MEMARAPDPGAYRDLSENQQHIINRWLVDLMVARAENRSGSEKVGLWCKGPTASGTTFAASVAVLKAVNLAKRDLYGTVDWEYIAARDLERLVRQSWSDPDRHPTDFDLFSEHSQVEAYVDWLFDCDLLWVDDLHVGVTDMSFFTRHLWPLMDRRVKRHKATVVASSLEARHLGQLTRAVQTWYHQLECDHATR